MDLLVSRKANNNYSINEGQRYQSFVSTGVTENFEQSIFDCAKKLQDFSNVTKEAMNEFDNIIVLKDKASSLPCEFASTEDKFINYASEAYGFVSRGDKAIVIVEDNHHRKNEELEGNLFNQAADTFAHEVGHIIDKDFSTTEEFKKAFLTDLEVIHTKLNNPDTQIEGENLRESLFYLKHYVDGVNFEDGISEEDITRTGLRENFAECFSTIVDANPSKINKIFSSLFPNTMTQTLAFIV